MYIVISLCLLVKLKRSFIQKCFYDHWWLKENAVEKLLICLHTNHSLLDWHWSGIKATFRGYPFHQLPEITKQRLVCDRSVTLEPLLVLMITLLEIYTQRIVKLCVLGYNCSCNTVFVKPQHFNCQNECMQLVAREHERNFFVLLSSLLYNIICKE